MEQKIVQLLKNKKFITKLFTTQFFAHLNRKIKTKITKKKLVIIVLVRHQKKLLYINLLKPNFFYILVNSLSKRQGIKEDFKGNNSRGQQMGKGLWILFSFWVCVVAKDYYSLLGVSRDAGEDQIKRAYRKLAQKMHPDKVKGSDEEKQQATEQFQEISHAYEVLSDPEKRRVYDRHGEEGLKNMGGGGGGGHDIFSQMFGGFFGGGFGFGDDYEEQVPKGDDVIVDLFVTLEDLYKGRELKVMRTKSVLVPTSGTRKCNCKNKVVTKQLGPGMFQQFTTKECEECPNVKFERESMEINVELDPGMHTGQDIVMFEQGEPEIDGDPGDLRFIVREVSHDRFIRKNNDLHYNQTISLIEALTGFEQEIVHLDGHRVQIKNTGITRPLQVDKIVGEGMPHYNKHGKFGDLYVTYTVDFPKKLTEEQKKQLKSILGQQ
eukprot:TRINITY_DN6512_c0_g1_i8.p1 TRINITY_DN6512_c0_g1~~TRINITY_DN6512_c0_g1_i8.p1  ORF type:complete len:435 (-),score=37.50 TRINITY_DN6512_c0_g1_i8:233-1537(-)